MDDAIFLTSDMRGTIAAKKHLTLFQKSRFDNKQSLMQGGKEKKNGFDSSRSNRWMDGWIGNDDEVDRTVGKNE